MSSNDGKMPVPLRFAFGGLSACMATTIVHPMDVLKNRMQMSGAGSRSREYKSSLHLLANVIKTEGLRAAYSGLTAGWLRQATYATTRLGIYTAMFERFSTRQPDGRSKPPSFSQQILIAIVAGGAGGAVGNPAEVCLVRMAVDGRLPPEQRRNYRNAIHALYRVTLDDGPSGLLRGLVPTVVRSIVTNVAQLVTYSQAKAFLLSTGYFGDNILTHFGAGMTSGLVTTLASLPADMAKTRIQNMRLIDGKPEYRGMTDVMLRVVRNEGFLSLWKGFTPYFLRVGPHTTLTLVFLEQITSFYAKHILGKDRIGSL